MAGKLTKEHMNLLEGMIGCGPKSFKLLYSITRDGCSAAEFHRKCDNQGPTVTVLLNPQGSVYGGYAGINWKSTGGFTMDDTAFIFQLVFSGIRVVNIFRPKDASKALYFGCNRSALFGNPDFEPFLDTISVNKDGTFSLNGRLTLGTYYNSNNVSNDAIHNGSMVVTELEVYAVSDDTRTSTPKQTTWRKTPALNEEYISKIAEELASITPPRGSGITDFRLLLVGPVGAGKSSFINTVMSPFADRIINKAAVGTSSQNVTRKFSYSRHISAKTPGFEHRPSLAEEAHCVGIVLDSSTIHDLPAVTMTLLNELKNLALEKGIPLAIILTKIDKLHEDIAENLADVFNRPEVKATVDQVSEALGIPPNHVFPVKNYHSEMETEIAVHGLALLALRKMIFIASDALEERTSAIAERQEATADVTESDTA